MEQVLREILLIVETAESSLLQTKDWAIDKNLQKTE